MLFPTVCRFLYKNNYNVEFSNDGNLIFFLIIKLFYIAQRKFESYTYTLYIYVEILLFKVNWNITQRLSFINFYPATARLKQKVRFMEMVTEMISGFGWCLKVSKGTIAGANLTRYGIYSLQFAGPK